MLSDINISHGSVATLLRCGGICNDIFIANFLLSVTVKEFGKSVIIWRSYGKDFSVLFLLDHSVYKQKERQTDTYNHNVQKAIKKELKITLHKIRTQETNIKEDTIEKNLKIYLNPQHIIPRP